MLDTKKPNEYTQGIVPRLNNTSGVFFTYSFKFGKLTHEGRLPDKSLYDTSLLV